jgi:hypothetical protein
MQRSDRHDVAGVPDGDVALGQRIDAAVAQENAMGWPAGSSNTFTTSSISSPSTSSGALARSGASRSGGKRAERTLSRCGQVLLRPDRWGIAQRRPWSEGSEQSRQPRRSCGQRQQLRNRRSLVRIQSGASTEGGGFRSALRSSPRLPNPSRLTEIRLCSLKPNRTLTQTSPRMVRSIQAPDHSGWSATASFRSCVGHDYLILLEDQRAEPLGRRTRCPTQLRPPDSQKQQGLLRRDRQIALRHHISKRTVVDWSVHKRNRN